MTQYEMPSEKVRASVVVVGYQKEDHRMYPHLYDFLKNLRCAYEEVVYLDDDDRGDGLYSFDRFLHNIVSVRGFKCLTSKLHKNAGSLVEKISSLARCEKPAAKQLSAVPPSFDAIGKDILSTFKKFTNHFVMRKRLIRKLRNINLKHDRRLLIAIDHTAVAVAIKHFKGRVALWSYDIPTKDYDSNHHMRIKNGIYEKFITRKGVLDTDILIIQDEKRKCLIEEAMDIHFDNTIYLPVSLNDSLFCAESAKSRRSKIDFTEVRIIQSGGIGKSRLSDRLVESYAKWPAHYSLTIHGVFFSHDMKELINQAIRKPELTSYMYGHDIYPSFLSNYDIGFVAYAENNLNHDYIQNASAQLVAFLRLGIPVIACASDVFNDFVDKHGIGRTVHDLDSMAIEIEKITANYDLYSKNARRVFEEKYNLNKIFDEYLVRSFEAVMSNV